MEVSPAGRPHPVMMHAAHAVAAARAAASTAAAAAAGSPGHDLINKNEQKDGDRGNGQHTQDGAFNLHQSSPFGFCAPRAFSISTRKGMRSAPSGGVNVKAMSVIPGAISQFSKSAQNLGCPSSSR